MQHESQIIDKNSQESSNDRIVKDLLGINDRAQSERLSTFNLIKSALDEGRISVTDVENLVQTIDAKLQNVALFKISYSDIYSEHNDIYNLVTSFFAKINNITENNVTKKDNSTVLNIRDLVVSTRLAHKCASILSDDYHKKRSDVNHMDENRELIRGRIEYLKNNIKSAGQDMEIEDGETAELSESDGETEIVPKYSKDTKRIMRTTQINNDALMSVLTKNEKYSPRDFYEKYHAGLTQEPVVREYISHMRSDILASTKAGILATARNTIRRRSSHPMHVETVIFLIIKTMKWLRVQSLDEFFSQCSGYGAGSLAAIIAGIKRSVAVDVWHDVLRGLRDGINQMVQSNLITNDASDKRKINDTTVELVEKSIEDFLNKKQNKSPDDLNGEQIKPKISTQNQKPDLEIDMDLEVEGGNIVHPNGTSDIVFCCPPYYDVERYDANNDNTNQSISTHKTYSQWFDGFIKPLIDSYAKALKGDGKGVGWLVIPERLVYGKLCDINQDYEKYLIMDDKYYASCINFRAMIVDYMSTLEPKLIPFCVKKHTKSEIVLAFSKGKEPQYHNSKENHNIVRELHKPQFFINSIADAKKSKTQEQIVQLQQKKDERNNNIIENNDIIKDKIAPRVDGQYKHSKRLAQEAQTEENKKPARQKNGIVYKMYKEMQEFTRQGDGSRILIVSAPTGTGKSLVMQRLIQQISKNNGSGKFNNRCVSVVQPQIALANGFKESGGVDQHTIHSQDNDFQHTKSSTAKEQYSAIYQKNVKTFVQDTFSGTLFYIVFSALNSDHALRKKYLGLKKSQNDGGDKRKKTKAISEAEELYNDLEKAIKEEPKVLELLREYFNNELILIDESHLLELKGQAAMKLIMKHTTAKIIAISATQNEEKNEFITAGLSKDAIHRHNINAKDAIEQKLIKPFVHIVPRGTLGASSVDVNTRVLDALTIQHDGRDIVDEKGIIYVKGIEEAKSLMEAINQKFSDRPDLKIFNCTGDFGNDAVAKFTKEKTGIAIACKRLIEGSNAKPQWVICANDPNITNFIQIAGRTCRKEDAMHNVGLVVSINSVNTNGDGPKFLSTYKADYVDNEIMSKAPDIRDKNGNKIEMFGETDVTKLDHNAIPNWEITHHNSQVLLESSKKMFNLKYKYPDSVLTQEERDLKAMCNVKMHNDLKCNDLKRRNVDQEEGDNLDIIHKNIKINTQDDPNMLNKGRQMPSCIDYNKFDFDFEGYQQVDSFWGRGNQEHVQQNLQNIFADVQQNEKGEQIQRKEQKYEQRLNQNHVKQNDGITSLNNIQGVGPDNVLQSSKAVNGNGTTFVDIGNFDNNQHNQHNVISLGDYALNENPNDNNVISPMSPLQLVKQDSNASWFDKRDIFSFDFRSN